MAAQIVTLEAGRVISLPPGTTEALGLREGSRFAVSHKDGTIILQPILTERLEELRGFFASDVDVVAELQQEHLQDKW